VHGSQKQVRPAVCQKSATPYLRILPVISADFIRKKIIRFLPFATSADPHFTNGQYCGRYGRQAVMADALLNGTDRRWCVGNLPTPV